MMRWLALVLLVPAAASAQAPAIAARPAWLCPGDSFRITHAGLAAPPAHVMRTDSTGSRTSPWSDSVWFSAHRETVLTAPGVPDADTVSVHPARMEHNWQRASATCAGRLSVSSFAIPPADASERIRPRSVTNRGSTAVTVTHRGVSVRLAPGETTHAFNDLSFSGDWGAVVETGAYNSFCPSASPTGPPFDILIVTACP